MLDYVGGRAADVSPQCPSMRGLHPALAHWTRLGEPDWAGVTAVLPAGLPGQHCRKTALAPRRAGCADGPRHYAEEVGGHVGLGLHPPTGGNPLVFTINFGTGVVVEGTCRLLPIRACPKA